MNDDLWIWLPPVLTLPATLIVVVSSAWLNTRAILAQMEKNAAELRLEFRTELPAVRTELASLTSQVRALEERAGLIYR